MTKFYQITVPTVIDRIYRVEAESAIQALDLYRNGGRPDPLGGNILPNLVFEEDDSSNAYEVQENATVMEIEEGRLQ